MIDFNKLNDEDVDEILFRFDQTEPGLQRRIVAKFAADRENLLVACKSAHSLLRKLGGKNHDPEYSELVEAITLAERPTGQ